MGRNLLCQCVRLSDVEDNDNGKDFIGLKLLNGRLLRSLKMRNLLCLGQPGRVHSVEKLMDCPQPFTARNLAEIWR